MEDNPQQTEANPRQPGIVHIGQVGELLAITLTNTFFQILTGGIYYFWGRTRKRRYLWSHTTYREERFEYTGTPWELFRGYVLAMGLFIPLVLGWQFVAEAFATELVIVAPGMLLFYGALGFLWGFAQFSSRRYLLSRTRWRSIRFGLMGSALRHGGLAVGFGLLAILTLGLATPWLRNRLRAHMLFNAWFGDLRLTYTGRDAAMLPRFLVLWVYGLLAVIGAGSLQFFLLSTITPGQIDPNGGFPPQILGILVVYVGVLIPAIWAGWAWYLAGELRYVVQHTTLGAIRLQLDIPTWPFVWLFTVNIIAMGLSLGTAFPWVAIRTLRFVTKHFEMLDPLDVDNIAQHPAEVPAIGEGMAEALDMGGI